MSDVKIDTLSLEINSNAKSATSGIDALSKSLDKLGAATKGGLGLTSVSKNLKTITKAVSLMKGVKAIKSAVESSANYVEKVNLFNIALGKYAVEAKKYADTIEDVMGIDPAEWMENQGIFMTLATGFGVVEDRAYKMSKNLTQLGYDIASFYNTDVKTAMQKLQSGLAGELEPLRRIGWDLSQARLEATALSLGIDKAVASMTQAEKAELRYYAIMTQVTQVQGDMARTLDDPANQMRIFTAQIQMAARAIGNIFIPLLNDILPYGIALVRVIREIASAIASLAGYEMPEVDNISSGAENVADAFDEATDSAKKLKRNVMGFDELNILGSGTGEEDTLASAFDFELPEYDFLKGAVEGRVDEIVKNMKEWLGLTGDISAKLKPILRVLKNILKIVGSIVAAVAAIQIGELVKKFKELELVSAFWDSFFVARATGGTFFQSILSGLDSVREKLTGVQRAAIVAVAAFAEFTVVRDNIKELALGADNAIGLVTEMGVVAGIAGLAMYTALGPAGLALAAVVGITAAVVGFSEAMSEMQEQVANESFFDGIGVSLDEFKEKLASNIEEVGIYNDKIIALGDSLTTGREKVGEIKEEITLFTTSMIGDGEITEEEIGKLKGYFDELYTNIKTNMENSSSIITTALVQAMQSATPEIAEQITLLIGEYQRFVRETQGRAAEIKLEIDSAYDSLIGLLPDSAEYQTTMGLINELYTELGYLSGGMSDAAWQWEQTVSKFDSGEIDFGEDVTEATEKIGEIAAVGETALADIATARDAVLKEIDNSILYASKYGSLEEVQLLGDIRATIEADYNAQEQAIKDELSRIFDSIQEGMITELYGTQERFEKEWDELNWLQQMFEGCDKETYVKRGMEASRPMFEGIEKAIQEQMDALEINGGTWATEAMDGIIEALFESRVRTSEMTGISRTYSDYKTTLDTAIKECFAELEKSGKKASHTTGEEITNGLGAGITSTIDEPVSAIEKVIDKVEAEGNRSAEIHSPSKRFARMGEYISSGLAEGITSLGSMVCTSLIDVLDTAFDLRIARDYGSSFGKALGNSIAKAIESVSLPSIGGVTAEVGSISGFASGGFPETGQMFIAREAGAEMVGSIGRRTAVANNDQIVSGIASGVAEANGEQTSLLREQNTLLRALLEKESGVYLDGKNITNSVEKYQRERGRVLVTGGAL